jgi:site-specific DNA-methyltransferase (adenine-specific)
MMKYAIKSEEVDSINFVAESIPATKTSKNKLAFKDEKAGVYLFEANCLELMDSIYKKYPNGCFDMIFADPPYFLSNGGITCKNGQMVSVNKGDWDRSKGADENHDFNREWLQRCQKILKPNGTIWISGTMHAIYSIGFAMQQLGFKMLNDIIWEKPNPPPNLSCRYFTHSTETILWAAKNKNSKHLFNYEAMKAMNGGKQMKSVWQIKPPTLSEKSHGKHPTQKPVSLVQRCIDASTKEGDFIFDPFSGSSTTGVSAIKNGRKFCGAEAEAEFIKLSKKRLQETINEYTK